MTSPSRSASEPSGAGRWTRLVLDFFLPPRCAGCRRRGVWWCDACRAACKPPLPPLCPNCSASTSRAGLCATCRAFPPAFDRVRAAYRYTGPLPAAIHRLKYGGQRVLGEILGEVVAATALRLAIEVDLVAPVPLHPARRRERGYNQSELLARAVATRLGRPVTTALVRLRPTPSQVGRDAASRRANVAGAFAWRGEPPAGQRLLLIDDVCTTGATLDACAQAIRPGSPASIEALVLARD